MTDRLYGEDMNDGKYTVTDRQICRLLKRNVTEGVNHLCRVALYGDSPTTRSEARRHVARVILGQS